MKNILLVITLCLTMIGQVSSQEFGDATAPEKVPSNQQVEVKVKTDAKFVSIKARKSLFDVAKVYLLDGGTRTLVENSQDLAALKDGVKKTDRIYVFTGTDGLYIVEITYFDPERGIQEEALKVLIGSDKAKVSISCQSQSVEEGKGTIVVTGTLDKVVDQEVTVTMNFGGTATLFKDYTVNPQACCISIPAGQLTGQMVLIPLVDAEKEGPESINLTIEKVLNAEIGDRKSCSSTILDSTSPNPPPTPDPDPDPPTPPVNSVEAQINAAMLLVPAALRDEMIAVRQADGNTLQVKAVLAVGRQYKDIAAEAKKNPGAWDVATMADESRVRVGGVIPSKSLNGWLPFFSGLTKLQKGLDPAKLDDWIQFFQSVNGVLSGESRRPPRL
jgi:hypothetical protein